MSTVTRAMLVKGKRLALVITGNKHGVSKKRETCVEYTKLSFIKQHSLLQGPFFTDNVGEDEAKYEKKKFKFSPPLGASSGTSAKLKIKNGIRVIMFCA